MFKTARPLAYLAGLLGLAMLSVDPARADDGSKGANCKKGWHMCRCKREARKHRLCETDRLWKLCNTCWGEIAQFQSLKGKKAETMQRAFAKARATDKLVLYIGNTGG